MYNKLIYEIYVSRNYGSQPSGGSFPTQLTMLNNRTSELGRLLARVKSVSVARKIYHQNGTLIQNLLRPLLKIYIFDN